MAAIVFPVVGVVACLAEPSFVDPSGGAGSSGSPDILGGKGVPLGAFGTAGAAVVLELTECHALAILGTVRSDDTPLLVVPVRPF